MHAHNGRPPPRRDAAPPTGAVVWALGPEAGQADVSALCDRLVALLRDSPTAEVICDVGAITEPDAGTIELLARLQLTAHRQGGRIRLRHPGHRLFALLALTGLAGVLGLGPRPTEPGELAVQAGGQPEQGEQVLGVEERVEPPDPAG